MSYAQRTLLALCLAAALPSCSDEVLTVPNDGSAPTSDRAVDAPAARADAEAGSSAASDASPSSDATADGGSDEADGGAD